MKTIEMVALRNVVLRSTSGHSVRFERNKPVRVPEECLTEALSLGAVPVDQTDIEVEDVVTPSEPVGMEREAALLAVFRQLVSNNSREDFTAGGKPSKRAVARGFGFDVDMREINELWTKFNGTDRDDA